MYPDEYIIFTYYKLCFRDGIEDDAEGKGQGQKSLSHIVGHKVTQPTCQSNLLCEPPMASISTKENTLSPSAAAEFKRYILRTKVESTVNKIRMKAIQCAGLIIAPCLLFCFVTLMGQYHNFKPSGSEVIKLTRSNIPIRSSLSNKCHRVCSSKRSLRFDRQSRAVIGSAV
jgi:hypothetical protein